MAQQESDMTQQLHHNQTTSVSSITMICIRMPFSASLWMPAYHAKASADLPKRQVTLLSADSPCETSSFSPCGSHFRSYCYSFKAMTRKSVSQDSIANLSANPNCPCRMCTSGFFFNYVHVTNPSLCSETIRGVEINQGGQKVTHTSINFPKRKASSKLVLRIKEIRARRRQNS